MRVAIVGAFGQLGSDLVPLLGDRAIPLGHADLEITDPVSIAKALDAARPTHVINCAAYNLVDQAEDEPKAAHRVNSLGPRNLAEWCAARGAVLMHVSTDYVFGADLTRRTPLGEVDPTGSVSVYGQSKLAGELAVRSLCPQHFIVRTCGLYGHRAARGKGNFVEIMLRLGRERPELRRGGPACFCIDRGHGSQVFGDIGHTFRSSGPASGRRSVMAWKDVSTMSQRAEFVVLASADSANVSELCRSVDRGPLTRRVRSL